MHHTLEDKPIESIPIKASNDSGLNFGISIPLKIEVCEEPGSSLNEFLHSSLACEEPKLDTPLQSF